MWSRVWNMMEVIDHGVMKGAALEMVATEIEDAQRNLNVKMMEELTIPWTKAMTADANSAVMLVTAMFNAGDRRAQSEEENVILEAMLQEIQGRQHALDKWLTLLRDWHDVRGHTKMSAPQPPLKEDVTMQVWLIDSVLATSLLSLSGYLATGYLFLLEVVRDALAIADQRDLGCIAKWKTIARIHKLNGDDEEDDEVDDD